MDSHGCESRQGPPTITHNDPQPSSTTEHSIVSSSPTVLPGTDNPCGPSVNMSFPGIYVIAKFRPASSKDRSLARAEIRRAIRGNWEEIREKIGSPMAYKWVSWYVVVLVWGGNV